MRVFVTRAISEPALTRLRDSVEVDVWQSSTPPTKLELIDSARETDGLLTMLSDNIDRQVMEALPQVKAIANYAVGVDNIDLPAANERGIRVGNTPDVLTDATADLTFALILALGRRIVDSAAAVRAGEWSTWEPQGWLGVDLTDTTLGIVGMGRIGSAVAQRAKAFGMKVLAHSRRSGVELNELLERSDVVSLHCPLTDRTRSMIGAAAFARMRPDALLINTARGPIVDTEALREALVEESIGGAALDVTDPEPLPHDHPLLGAPNLLVVPHIASATHRTRATMAEMSVDNLLAGLAGETMPFPVSS